jgi:hypothetical protein
MNRKYPVPAPMYMHLITELGGMTVKYLRGLESGSKPGCGEGSSGLAFDQLVAVKRRNRVLASSVSIIHIE